MAINAEAVYRTAPATPGQLIMNTYLCFRMMNIPGYRMAFRTDRKVSKLQFKRDVIYLADQLALQGAAL